MSEKRCLLHVNKLAAFKAYLDTQGIAHREGKGQCQVLQVYLGDGWFLVLRRNDTKEHYTAQEKLIRTVKQFVMSGMGLPAVAPVVLGELTEKDLYLGQKVRIKDTCEVYDDWKDAVCVIVGLRKRQQDTEVSIELEEEGEPGKYDGWELADIERLPVE